MAASVATAAAAISVIVSSLHSSAAHVLLRSSSLPLSLYLWYTALSVLSCAALSLSLSLPCTLSISLCTASLLRLSQLFPAHSKLGSTSPHHTPPHHTTAQLSSAQLTEFTTAHHASVYFAFGRACFGGVALVCCFFHPKLGQPLNPLSRQGVDVNVAVAVAAAAASAAVAAVAAADVAASAACAVLLLLLLLFGHTQHVFFGSEDACRPTVTCCDVDCDADVDVDGDRDWKSGLKRRSLCALRNCSDFGLAWFDLTWPS